MIFKPVPKANEYEMSMDGDIRRVDGAECTLTIRNNEQCITLKIFNEVKTLSIEWLRLLTHFEVDLPKKYFFNVYFVDTKDWQYSNKVNKTMWFYGPRPEYKPGFRYVPEFTRYAVSKTGELIDTYTDNAVNWQKPDRNDYIKVSIYNPDKGKNTNQVLHRLVALAWVKNPNPLKYYLVNHDDGNKLNPHYSNLIWDDYSGNSNHAYKTGLRSQNIPCKVLDAKTKEIHEFSSLSKAVNFMSSNRYNTSKLSFNFLRPNKLYLDRYEIRLKDDNRPWFHLNENDITAPGKYNVKILYPDGSEKIIYNLYDFRSDLNIKIRTSVSVWVLVERAQLMYPDLKFEVIDLYQTNKVQAYEVSTGRIFEADNHYLMSKKLNRLRTSIKYCLISKDETFVSKGFAYRYKTDKKWNTNFSESVSKAVCILATNNNGKEYECASIREAERLTKVNRKAIRRSIRGYSIETNWHFKNKVLT